VLDVYGFELSSVERITAGLINETFCVRRGDRRFALQRLHPVFDASVNRDIDAITAHVAKRGLLTPRLLPTRDGALWVNAPGGVWRALTWVDGVVHGRVTSPALARSAAALAARFHHATSDLAHEFSFARAGVHDTAAHLAALSTTVRDGRGAPLYDEVRPVAEQILDEAAGLERLPSEPRRIVHGDLKITNVLFDDATDVAIALIDLDTLAWGTLAVELGDALRSWCNPRGEDEPESEIDAATFEAAVSGYAEGAREVGALVTPAERAALVTATRTISLELAARFCRDALEDRYFGWDPGRFGSRALHNLTRARSQLSLARSVEGRRDALEALVHHAFEPGARADPMAR
jgi:Ser/Thr protein kinase RdoA (MazF antagonist)